MDEIFREKKYTLILFFFFYCFFWFIWRSGWGLGISCPTTLVHMIETLHQAEVEACQCATNVRYNTCEMHKSVIASWLIGYKGLVYKKLICVDLKAIRWALSLNIVRHLCLKLKVQFSFWDTINVTNHMVNIFRLQPLSIMKFLYCQKDIKVKYGLLIWGKKEYVPRPHRSL